MRIELRLDCVGQSSFGMDFQLAVTNREPRRFLLPYPKITGLEFTESSGATAQWYTSLLVSSKWSGLVLDPSESKTVRFSVRPNSVLRPQREDGSDYYRWSVSLRSGPYAVHYSMLTDANYFDGDSHYRFPDVLKKAREFRAVAWIGQAQSNAVAIEHSELDAPPNAGPSAPSGNSATTGEPPSVT